VSYSYRAYGFGINSTIPIAGLESCAPDVRGGELFFETGPAPDWAIAGKILPGRVISHRPEDVETLDPSFVLTEHGQGKCFELAYSDGTCFVIDESAHRIWGTFEPPLTPEDLATYFLGPVMGFLLRQRHVTCLHASAVEIWGHAVAFSGDAGQGKSTTAAALALRGIPVLSEDIVPLEESKGCFQAVPGYPRVCLWPDSVTHLLGSPDALPRLTQVWEKRFLPLDGNRANFAAQKRLLSLIYLIAPRMENDSSPRIEKMQPREALLGLVQNTYMNWLLHGEHRANEFDTLWRLVRHTEVRRLVPHMDPRKLGALCDLILKDAEMVLSGKLTMAPLVDR
jgi:hypothetical protein